MPHGLNVKELNWDDLNNWWSMLARLRDDYSKLDLYKCEKRQASMVNDLLVAVREEVEQR